MTLNGSIRKQLQLLAVVPALIMLLSLLLALTWQRFQDAEQDLLERGNYIARYIAASAEYGLLSGNTEELRRQARFAMQNVDVLKVAFFSRENTLVVSVEGAHAAPENENQLRAFQASVYRQPMLMLTAADSFVSPSSVAGPQKIGHVEVFLSDAGVASRQRKILLASIAPAVLALLFGLWIARRMASRVSQPIQYLSQLVQKIRGGEYQARGELVLRGELATLQSDINQLAVEQERSQQEQEKAMDALHNACIRAESASQTKSEFLAMMSHELRTPMNGVLGMLQLLQSSQLNSTQGEYACAAVESTSHLLNVINDVLDFSKVESGCLELGSSYFRFDELLENCVSGFHYAASQKSLQLELRGVEKLRGLEVRSDAARIRQIFSNLIGNAMKFTERGFVRLSVELDLASAGRACVTVRVEDSGIGILREKLTDLFDAFTQVDSSTSRQFGGTGLGLAIVRRLMHLLGGEISVESDLGQGACFICIFDFAVRQAPAEPDFDMAAVPAMNVASELNRSVSGRVLLVEDNDVNRMVAEHMLIAMGLDVVSAVNGEEALQILESQVLDCVLMDVQMPVMDGLTAVTHWRHREAELRRKRVPVIALTANALSGERERCLAAGMDDYLAKPFQRQKLVSMVSDYLSSK